MGCFEPFQAILGVDNLKLDEKNFDIMRFWAELPPEMPPVSGYMNQKTIEMDRYDPCLVPEVVQYSQNIDCGDPLGEHVKKVWFLSILGKMTPGNDPRDSLVVAI